MALLTPVQRLHLTNGLLMVQQQHAANTKTVAHLLHGRRRACQQQRRRYWVREWLIRRPLYGMYEKLTFYGTSWHDQAELQIEDRCECRRYVYHRDPPYWCLLDLTGSYWFVLVPTNSHRVRIEYLSPPYCIVQHRIAIALQRIVSYQFVFSSILIRTYHCTAPY